MWVKCLFIPHLHFYHVNLDRFTFACKNALYFWYTSESFGHLPLSAASSHPPHSHAHTYTHAYTLPPRWTVPHSHSVICSPSCFLHTPAFSSSPSLLLPFTAPLTTAAVIHLMKQRDIWRFQPTYFSLPPSLFFFQLILLPLLPQCCFFVFSSKFLLQRCCTFLEKGDRMLVKNFEFRFLCSCVVCVCLSLLRFI